MTRNEIQNSVQARAQADRAYGEQLSAAWADLRDKVTDRLLGAKKRKALSYEVHHAQQAAREAFLAAIHSGSSISDAAAIAFEAKAR